MTVNLFILAQDSDDLVKVLFFVVAGAIWLINAVVGGIKKRQEEQQRERLRRQLELEGGLRPTTAPPPRPAPQQSHPTQYGQPLPYGQQPTQYGQPLPYGQQPTQYGQPHAYGQQPQYGSTAQVRPRPTQAPPRSAQPRPVPMQPPAMRAPPLPRPAQRAAQKPKRAPKRVAAPPPPPQLGELLQSVEVLDSATVSTAALSPSRAEPVAAPASAVARWLNPRTLQHQFILTEILQPPLAMRERHIEL